MSNLGAVSYVIYTVIKMIKCCDINENGLKLLLIKQQVNSAIVITIYDVLFPSETT